MSEHLECTDSYGDRIVVYRDGDGEVVVRFYDDLGDEYTSMLFQEDKLAEFRELLDRAAMPGVT